MKPISTRTHTIIGLAVGAALIIAPWLFGFAEQGGAAVTIPIAIGGFILLSELTTTSPISLLKLVPMRIHIIADVLTGILLLASPWLFNFTSLVPNAWLPHVVVGILIVSYALLTRTADEPYTLVKGPEKQV